MPRIELSVNGAARAVETRVDAALRERMCEGCEPTSPKDGGSPTGQCGCAQENRHSDSVPSSSNTRGEATALAGLAHFITGKRKPQAIERAFLEPESCLAVLRAQWMTQFDVRSIAAPEPEQPLGDRSCGEISLVAPAPAVANVLHRCNSVRRHALLSQDSQTARYFTGKKPIAAVPN